MEKVILVILDGFGVGKNDIKKNAIYAANTPFFKKLWDENNYALISASEDEVGLQFNQFGNSELGHMTIGTGRTILGENKIFDEIINENKIDEYLNSLDWVRKALQNSRPIHICGMYSFGKVHSNAEHFLAIINFFQKYNKKISLHLITDGRDTKPNQFVIDWNELKKILKPTTQVVSISGRYFGMDRDKNFDRIQKFYNAMNSENIVNKNVDEYIDYEMNINNHDDEFIEPISFNVDDEYKLKNNDQILFMNYRADRIRQIIHAFNKTKLFEYKFNWDSKYKLIGFCEYPDIQLDNYIVESKKKYETLSQILSINKIRQLHIAETEKFAHVTFFFNGGNDKKYPLQENILITSKKTKTYDLIPEMSANEITDMIEQKINEFDFIVVNYANADMVGHTGNFEATKNAVEILDKQCALLYNLIYKYNHTLLITSDHGNADVMLDENNKIVKTHSISKVPLFVLSNKYKLKYKVGRLQDIAPSILYIYGLQFNEQIDGKNLLEKIN